jgi:hypothetical protein
MVFFSTCFPHAAQTTLVTHVVARSWTIPSIICSVLPVATDFTAARITGSVTEFQSPRQLSSTGS